MLNWLATGLVAKQVVKIVAIRFNVLSRWHTVPRGHSTILEADQVALGNIYYLPAEYCFNRGFHFQIPGRDDCIYDMVGPPDILAVYTDGSKLDNGVGSGIYSGRPGLNISLHLPDYCSVEVMAI